MYKLVEVRMTPMGRTSRKTYGPYAAMCDAAAARSTILEARLYYHRHSGGELKHTVRGGYYQRDGRWAAELVLYTGPYGSPEHCRYRYFIQNQGIGKFKER